MSLPRIEKIEDPIAEDYWGYKKDGREAVSHIMIGRPQPLPDEENGDWYCPVWIEGFAPMVLCLVGVGPVDALANAMGMIKQFEESVGGVRPRAHEEAE